MKVAIDIDNTIVDYRKLIIDYLVNNQYEFQNKYQLKSDFSLNFIKIGGAFRLKHPIQLMHLYFGKTEE